MVLAADYPFLDFLWSMLLVFLWIAWFFILFRVIIDIFRRHELSGFGKVAWLIFVILLPFLGVFVYIIVEGRHMGERDMRRPRPPNSSSIHTSSPSPRAAVRPRKSSGRSRCSTAVRSPRRSSTRSSRRRSPPADTHSRKE